MASFRPVLKTAAAAVAGFFVAGGIAYALASAGVKDAGVRLLGTGPPLHLRYHAPDHQKHAHTRRGAALSPTAAPPEEPVPELSPEPEPEPAPVEETVPGGEQSKPPSSPSPKGHGQIFE